MSCPWNDFLERVRGEHPSLLAFAIHWWQYNIPLMQHIRQTVSFPASILEVGTGTGALSIFLAAHGYDVLGIDNDPLVIEAARKLADYFRVSCRFELQDAFDLSAYRGEFDLAFSSGVIEHFPIDDASRMLREQGMAANYVLVSVPTWFGLKNDPQAESSGARPIRLRELKYICRLAGLEVLKGFGYGVPDGSFAVIYRHFLPHVMQWFLQNQLSYACTVGCLARSRDHVSQSGALK